MAGNNTGSFLANLVRQKQLRVKASLALGITPPPATPTAPATTPAEDPMLTHVRQFLESLKNV